MATGIKTGDLQEDLSGIEFDEAFLARTSIGLARVKRRYVRGLDARLVRVIGTTTPALTLNDAEHYRSFLTVNNSGAAVAFTIPASASALPDIEDQEFGGLYAEFAIASGAFDVSFTVTETNTLRGVGAGSALIEDDTQFVGLNRSLADEAIVRLWKRGALWILESTNGLRGAAAGDLLRPLSIDASQNRVITDADHANPVWLTAADPGTLTFQADIATGTQTTVINAGTSAVAINYGSHTNLSGDTSIAPGQAASVIVGPVTTGVNKSIFVAASA